MPYERLARAVLPFLMPLVLVLLAVTFVPPLTTTLGSLAAGGR